MDLQIKDKLFIVTGATSGLGNGVARALLNEEAKVISVARDEEKLQNFIQEKHFRIVINCKSLTYVASAGLGVLMGVIDEIRANDGDIRFAEMSPNVLNIFEILGFTHLYKVFEDEDKAVESFTASHA